MAANRMLRMSRPLGHVFSQQVFSKSAFLSKGSRPRTQMCLSKVGPSSNDPSDGSERKPVVVMAAGCTSACVLVLEPKIDKRDHLDVLLLAVADGVSHWLKFITKRMTWKLNFEMIIEKVIMDCRFFTILATAGSLLGSFLCFVEGCFLILESYSQYFHGLSQVSGQGHVVLMLIEAIDVFLVGTAMLIFGMALHVMFVGQNNLKPLHSTPNLSQNFNLQKLPSWIGMESVIQAKSKSGHAVIMILQVEVLEKFKSVPLVNGLDLACFVGTVFLSSAAIFVLSRIAVSHAETSR
ncbi:hypothetical protein CDL12_11519 [Handroanthus impetiginosus]|uniref:Uncharacterized protein n=1 Tax=Handroanthus impetiginosus TaxID=429701 RepID=A0A2G9HE87_9LAMI|nr:hypothetical protein CDL12_11519 [Handroanthus impetiginosus]